MTNDQKTKELVLTTGHSSWWKNKKYRRDKEAAGDGQPADVDHPWKPVRHGASRQDVHRVQIAVFRHPRRHRRDDTGQGRSQEGLSKRRDRLLEEGTERGETAIAIGGRGRP